MSRICLTLLFILILRDIKIWKFIFENFDVGYRVCVWKGGGGISHFIKI